MVSELALSAQIIGPRLPRSHEAFASIHSGREAPSVKREEQSAWLRPNTLDVNLIARRLARFDVVRPLWSCSHVDREYRQTPIDCRETGLRAVIDTQLGVDTLDVITRRLLGDVQFGSDLTVRPALRDQP